MNNKTHIRGAIGYSILENKNKKIMVISDMHYIKDKCGKMFISDWLKKQKNFKLLLEEVPPTNVKLKELWDDKDNITHTKKLRNLYIDNIDKIVGLDTRGELLPFSWELLTDLKDFKDLKDLNFPQITLEEYLININNFFKFKHEFFLKDIPEIYKNDILTDKNIKISIQFDFCFNKYNEIKTTYSYLMNNYIQDIFKNKNKNEKNVLEEINILLNIIMEFYTIMQVYKLSLFGVNRFIIHAGLFHTSNIVKWLRHLYNFELIDTDGLTDFDKVNLTKHTGCLNIPNI